MNKSSTFIKGFITLFSGNVIAQIIPFLFAPILSRIFTEEEFAIQANFMAIVGIIAIIAGGRYELALVLPKTNKKALNLFGVSISFVSVFSFLAFTILLFKTQIQQIYETDALNKYLIFIPVAVFVSGSISVFLNWLVRDKKYKTISIVKIIQSITINIITLVMGYMKFGEKGLIYGWLIGLAITSVISWLSIQKDINIDHINKKEMLSVAKKYKDFPLINSFHAFADLFFSQFILYAIITREFGLAYLGLFYMMNKYLKAPIRVIGSAVGQVYYKEANEKLLNNENVTKVLIHSIKLTAYFAIPICIILLFFGPYLFEWYLGDKWRTSGVYAQIMAVPILFNFIVSPISSTTLIYQQQKKALLISLIGYTFSVIALLTGVYLNLNFKTTLILFAISMSLYYIFLLIWYYSLTLNK